MVLRIDAAYLQESHKLSTRQRRTAFDNAWTLLLKVQILRRNFHNSE